MLITPVSLYSVVDPVTRVVDPSNELFSQLTTALKNAASPLSLALCNSFIIPCLVDLVARCQFNETKSALQKKIFTMNLFFMGLNMIILPLTGLISIQDFIDYGLTNEFRVINELAVRIGQMAAFFTTYMMQVTFLFNCIQVLDLGHLFISLIWSRFLKTIQGLEFRDEYPFDLGYWLAFTSTIGLMSLIFSTVMPILTLFSFIFFATRYYIEKYNVIFVYMQDFDSKGTMLQVIVPYGIIGVLFYQILNFAFLRSYGLDDKWFYLGYAFISLQIVCALALNIVNSRYPNFLKANTKKISADIDRKE